MKLGIMQPYFLPYIGYWQLMNAVDEYVVYDDVNFIKGGWINRNNLLMNGAPCLFSLPLRAASPYKRINEIEMLPVPPSFLRTVVQAYSKAPRFDDVYPLVEQIVSFQTAQLSTFLLNSIVSVARFLQMKTAITVSSQLEKDSALKGQEKVLDICRRLGATEYYNAAGGRDLYSRADFDAKNVTLRFLETEGVQYRQFREPFVPNLSILDLLMFCSPEEANVLLGRYRLD